MKVVCINEGYQNPDLPRVFVGQEYTVKRIVLGFEVKHIDEDGVFYELFEVGEGVCCFHHRLFGRLSEIDETQFERNYKTQLA